MDAFYSNWALSQGLVRDNSVGQPFPEYLKTRVAVWRAPHLWGEDRDVAIFYLVNDIADSDTLVQYVVVYGPKP